MEARSPRMVVILPTYNEVKNIDALTKAIRGVLPDARILIVDDNSPDGTGALADRLAEQDAKIEVLHRARKEGLGAALLAAFRWVMDRDYDFAITMDADFSHSPRYLPDLIAGMDGHDVMIGSRYVAGGGIEGWGASRHLMSQGINLYSRLALGVSARDTSGAFRCYRVAKLRDIDLGRVLSRGYSFMEEILYRCQKAGCKIGETPIVFENRKFGKSKINWREAVRAVWILARLGLARGRG